MEHAHGLRPFDARVTREQGGDTFRWLAFGGFQYVAVQAQRRHGPAVQQLEIVALSQFLGDAAARAAAAVIDVIASIAGVGTKVGRGQAQHHKQPAFRGGGVVHRSGARRRGNLTQRRGRGGRGQHMQGGCQGH
jgi:hypothetical protein